MQRLFQPLGMRRTHFRPDYSSIEPGRARSYHRVGDRLMEAASHWNQSGGDGGLQTNVLEFAHWDGNFTSARVGGPRVMAALEQTSATREGGSSGYARGVATDVWSGLRRVSHTGEWEGFEAAYMRLPEAGVSVAVLCNTDQADAKALAEGVARVVLPQRPPAQAASARLAAAVAAAFPGTWYDEGSQSVRVVGLAPGGGLALLGWDGTPEAPLEAVDERRLRVPSGQAVLALEDDGRQLLAWSPAPGERRYRRTVPPAGARPGDGVEGAYRSDELGVTWQVEQRASAWSLRARGIGSLALRTFMVDGLRAEDGTTLVFTRDAAGEVDGMDVATAGVSHLHFVRARP